MHNLDAGGCGQAVQSRLVSLWVGSVKSRRAQPVLGISRRLTRALSTAFPAFIPSLIHPTQATFTDQKSAHPRFTQAPDATTTSFSLFSYDIYQTCLSPYVLNQANWVVVGSRE